MKIQNSVSLKEYNTTKIDCTAKHFVTAINKDEIVSSIKYARENNIDFLILGGGSNIILPKTYSGLVICISNKDYITEEKDDKVLLVAGAGAFLPDVSKSVSSLFGSGLEWAGGVPGTIGGSVRGNAGAFGDFTADFIKKIEVLDIKTLKEGFLEKEDCYFDYRESIFKKQKNYIILSAFMEFPKKGDALKKYKEYLDYRKKNHPTEPSSGSVFKNPIVTEDFFKRHKDTAKFSNLGFVPIRYLIGECGLSGKEIGGAQISKKHPNFIININNATLSDIKKLIDIVKENIKEKYNIVVDPEVEIIDEN